MHKGGDCLGGASLGSVDSKRGDAVGVALCLAIAAIGRGGIVVLYVWQNALEGLEDLAGLVGAAFFDALLEDVGRGPEHTQRGVLAFVDSIHRTDGVVGFLDAALPP